jgi:hypothetical protein
VPLYSGIEIVDGIAHSVFSFQWYKILAAVKMFVIPAANMEYVRAV